MMLWSCAIERCLYVRTGGFTQYARYEADRAAVPLTLVDLPVLRELLLGQCGGCMRRLVIVLLTRPRSSKNVPLTRHRNPSVA